MSRQVNSGDPSSGYPSKRDFDQTGAIADADLTVTAVNDKTKKIVFDGSSLPTGTTATLKIIDNNSVTQKTWTITGAGTVSGLTVNSQVLGTAMFVSGRFTSGTSTAVAFSLNLPSGYTLDTANLPAATQIVGNMHLVTGTSGWPTQSVGPYPIFFDGTTNNKLFISLVAVAGELSKSNGNDAMASGYGVHFNFMVPIVKS